MFNCKIEFNNTTANVNFPCTNNLLYAKFAEMHVPDEIKAKIDIQIVEIDYEPLKCLEGKSYDPDAVNLLAQKLDSFTENEIRKFEAAREMNRITDIYDMINLTENMHYYTLVTDMSDIKAVGKLHIMTKDGGIAAGEVDNIDFEAIGKKLIETGNGRITKYGNIYINSDLEYYEPCTRESLPPFQYYDRMLVCVEMSYQGNTNYVYLPDTPMALERAAYRMGAKDLSQCKYEIDYCDFHMGGYEEEREIKFNPDKLQEYLENILNNEGAEKLYATVFWIARLSNEKLAMLVPVINYADRYDSEAVIKLAECIDSFEVYGNVSSLYDLGIALINDNPYYELHPDIEDYFNFEKYGEDTDMEWDGKFLAGDIYVGISDSTTLENIFNGNEPDEDIEEGFELSM